MNVMWRKMSCGLPSPKMGAWIRAKALHYYNYNSRIQLFLIFNLMFCLYFSVSTWSENRTGFGIRSSKYSSTSHRLSSKADVGLKGPKA